MFQTLDPDNRKSPFLQSCNHIMKSFTVCKRNLGSSKSHGSWVIRPFWVLGGNKGVAAWEFLFHVNYHLARLHRIYKQEPFPIPCLPVVFSPGSSPHPPCSLQQRGWMWSRCPANHEGHWLGVIPYSLYSPSSVLM